MNLKQYPTAIADREKQLLRLQRKIRKATNHLDQLSADIEIAIATDPDLKNEQQRKAKRLVLLSDQGYLEAQHRLHEYFDRRTNIEILLKQIRNQFSVAKLELKRQIALRDMEAA